MLVVAPLSGHHSTLLRETVRELLQDHKVYVTDWTDARMVPEAGPFHLDDYVAYVQEFIRHIGPEVNVISVCQPTVPVLAAVSLMASAGEPTPRTMTMMGGPIDARKSPTAVNNLATNKSQSWFENNVIYRVPPNYPGAGRRVYPGFLQHTGFIAMNPDRHLKSHYDYFLDLVRGDDDNAEAHREFYDEYNAVLDMPAEYYLDTIKAVFQDFALVNGTWTIGERAGAPAGHHHDGAADHRRRARRHLRRRPDQGRARAVHRHSGDRRFHYDVQAPATTASSRAGAGAKGLSRSARLHRRAPGRRQRHGQEARRGARQAPQSAAPERRGGAMPVGRGRPRRCCRRRSAPAAATPTAAAMPRPSPEGPRSTTARPAAPKASAAGAAPGRRCCRSTRPAAWKAPRALAVIDEAWCIGCTLCIKACPVDASSARPSRCTPSSRAVHRLRTVRAGVPGRLHRARSARGDRTGWEAWSEAQAEQARDRYAIKARLAPRERSEGHDERGAPGDQRSPGARARRLSAR